MPKATHTDTTTAPAPDVAPVPPTASVDAPLLALAAEFQRVDAHVVALGAPDAPPNTWESAGPAVQDRWWEIANSVIDLPAHTQAGWAAKAAMIPAVFRDIGDEGNADHTLALSLVRAMIAPNDGGPDVDLLVACEAFQAVNREMKDPRRGDTDADDEALGLIVERWYAVLDAVVAIPARTAAGQQAKLRTAFVALEDAMHDEPMHGNREEFATLTVLAELLGADLVLPAADPDPDGGEAGASAPATASDDRSDMSFFAIEGVLRDMGADISMIGHVAKFPIDVSEQVWHRLRDNLEDGFNQLNDTWQAAADNLRAKHVALDTERAAFEAELTAARAERAPPGSQGDLKVAEGLWGMLRSAARVMQQECDKALSGGETVA
jgi:hypothetical protein